MFFIIYMIPVPVKLLFQHQKSGLLFNMHSNCIWWLHKVRFYTYAMGLLDL